MFLQGNKKNKGASCEYLSYSISVLNHIRAVSGLALMKISRFSGILNTRKAWTSSSGVISIVFQHIDVVFDRVLIHNSWLVPLIFHLLRPYFHVFSIIGATSLFFPLRLFGSFSCPFLEGALAKLGCVWWGSTTIFSWTNTSMIESLDVLDQDWRLQEMLR